MSLSINALNIAITQLGYEEEPRGSNWGPHVKKYLNSVGLNFAASWCMAFIYWCFREAANLSGYTTPLVKTGGVLNHWNKAGKQYKFTADPQPGDIFIMDLGKGL